MAFARSAAVPAACANMPNHSSWDWPPGNLQRFAHQSMSSEGSLSFSTYTALLTPQVSSVLMFEPAFTHFHHCERGERGRS
jgi:hypothetical protein